MGSEHEVDPHTDPSPFDEGGAARRGGVDAAAEGGVQSPDRLHLHEQIQRQRLVSHIGRQRRGDAMDWQVLVCPQPPQVRIRPPIRYSSHLPRHRARDRAPPARRQDSQG